MPDMQAAQGADLSDVAPPSIEDVFSLRRPRDIRAGLSSGIKSVGKGIVGGAVGLLAAPIVGAATDGLPGFAKGVAAGVAGAVLLPVTGVTVGVVQVARGVANQPTALMESLRGKAWDQEQRTWVEQPNSALTTYDAAASAHWQRLGLLHLQSSAQLDYYALLEVPKDAPAEQIKRQYYKLARRHHPDKNAGDPAAHERFQQLGNAYQVLSTPVLRKRYDAAGASAVADVDWLEPGAFFAALFGSEMFEHLVGELAIATMAKVEDGGSDAPSPAELRALQAARVERLVVLLAALLRRYVEGDVEGFRLAMRCEAERLAGASFGVTLLHCIGRVYSRQADIYLGGLLGGALARVKLGRDSVRSHFDIANAALRVISHQEMVAAFDRQCEQRRQQQQQVQCQPPEQLQQQQINQQQMQVDQQQHQQLLQEQLAEQQQQQQQQCITEQLDMAVGQPRPSAGDADAACAATAADEAAVVGDADSPQALDAWDAVWFGNSSSAAAAAAGMPEHAAKQQENKQQRGRSSRKGQKAGRLGSRRPRDQESFKHEQIQQQQQQQPEAAEMQIPAGNSGSHCVGSSTEFERGGSEMSSSSSSDHTTDEQDAAGSNHFDTSAGCWQPLQQQLHVLSSQTAVAGNSASKGSSNAAAGEGSASMPADQVDAGSNADAAAGSASAGVTSSAAGKQAAATATASAEELLLRAKLEVGSMNAAATDAAAGTASTTEELLQRAQLEDAGMAASATDAATDAAAAAAAAAAMPASSSCERCSRSSRVLLGPAAAAGPSSTLDDLLQHSQLEDSSMDAAAAAAGPSSSLDDLLQRSQLEDAGMPASAAAATDAAATAAPSSSLDDLLQRSQLEDAGMDLMLAAMWAANVVDIQATLGRVCRGVLYDRRASRAQRRLRASALRELGAIFCAAEAAGGSSSSSQHAKQQMQAAYEAVMARQMAGQEAADAQ